MPTTEIREKQERFEELAFEHLPALRRTALRMARSESDADDLVQEAVMKAFRALHQFREGTNFRAWIFRILVNTYINRYRRKEREPIPVDFGELEPIHVEAGRDSHEMTLGDLDRVKEHLSDEVKEGLETMPEEYRTVFLLSTLEGFAYQEIADITSVPIGTVMSRLFRARKHMRDRLEEYAIDSGFLRNT